jgi:hypothetical protein
MLTRAAQLVGGSDRDMKDGMHIRGDLHICATALKQCQRPVCFLTLLSKV